MIKVINLIIYDKRNQIKAITHNKIVNLHNLLMYEE